MKMKTTILLLNAAAALSLLASASSCTKTRTDIGPETGTYIEFASALTRTTVESPDDIDEFAVWGYYQNADGTYQDVFGQIGTENTGVPVRNENGGWVYDDLKKWEFGVRYNFYAIYPQHIRHLVEVPGIGGGDPFMSVLDYDVSAQDNDLMFAAAESIRYDDGETPAPVRFTFSHLLSKVDFIASIDPATLANLPDFKAKITEAKLYGMAKEAHLSAQDLEQTDMTTVVWNTVDGTITDSSNPFKKIPESNIPASIELDSQEQSVFGKEFYVFPSGDISDYILEIHWTVTAEAGASPIERSQQIRLVSPNARSWVAGKRYRYSFTISDTDHILFDIPSVTPWTDASGGIIVVE